MKTEKIHTHSYTAYHLLVWCGVVFCFLLFSYQVYTTTEKFTQAESALPIDATVSHLFISNPHDHMASKRC